MVSSRQYLVERRCGTGPERHDDVGAGVLEPLHLVGLQSVVDDDGVELLQIADAVDGPSGELGVVDEKDAQLGTFDEGALEVGGGARGWKHMPRDTAGTDMNRTS